MTVFLRAHDFKSFACHIISYHLVQNLLEVTCSIKLVKSVSSRQVLCYSIVKKGRKAINIIIIYNAISTTNSFIGESANSIYLSSYSFNV